MPTQDDYPSPVSDLLNHGPIQSSATGEWFDYIGHYGLGASDVPDLISLANGYDLNPQNPMHHDAPIHACRALGQLGDAAADDYLVELLGNYANDGLTESVLVALSMLGPRSLAVLKQYFERTDLSHWSRALAADGLAVFAKRHPQYRDECVAFLAQALSNFSMHTPEINGFLILNLVQLNATEAVEQIEQAFQAKAVEEGITDTWPAVQIELGLACEDDFTAEELRGENGLWGNEPDTTSARQTTSHRRPLSDIGLAGGYSIVEHLRT